MKLYKRILILIGICLGIAVGAMAFSAINTALPAIKKDLGASLAQLQWIMNIFGIAICSTLVTAGRLADIYGRKRLYLIGIFGLAISMLGSGLSPNANWIIFFQAILGLSAAILIPVSQALISNAFPTEERSKAIGIWAAVVGIAMAVGPLLSGFIITIFTWRWVFLISIPFILISLILVAIVATESKSDEQQSNIDWLGIIFLAITISSFVLAVLQGGIWKTAIILSLYGISFLAGLLLFYIEKKVPMPIIREELFTHRMFLTASLANFCLIFFVWAVFFLLPIYLQTIHHYSALQAGLIMLLFTIPLTIFSFVGGYLYKLFGPKPLILIGFIFLILSAITQMYFQPDTLFIVIAFATACFGMGWGMIWGPTTTAAISTLPQTQAGIASGSFVTIQEIGGTVGLAITGSIVRLHPNLLMGYHNGMWVLILMCCIGFIATLFMKPR